MNRINWDSDFWFLRSYAQFLCYCDLSDSGLKHLHPDQFNLHSMRRRSSNKHPVLNLGALFSMFSPFTVSQVDYANVSEPLNSFGNQCTVASQSTTACSVTLTPIPLSMGNGTVQKSIKLKLISMPYPQLVFNRTVNVTIYHYLTPNESFYLGIYDSVHSRYLGQNLTYNYFCSAYGICNSGVSYGISVTGAYIQLATDNINHGSISQAIYNVTSANRTLNGGVLQYNLFVNTSNKIVNNVLLARYMLANSSNY